MKSDNQTWIFLSHSSKDIEKVRIVRNEFEKYGKNPLAFHLKCLNTDSFEGKQEVVSLIHREIEARDWFVYCNSANAMNSEFVIDERNYVKKLNKKNIKIFDINLDDDKENIEKAVLKIVKSSNIVISYAAKDIEFAKALTTRLQNRDYSIFLSENTLEIYGEYASSVTRKIIECDYFLQIISKNYQWLQGADIEAAIIKGKKIIPIIIDDTRIKSIYNTLLYKNNFYRINKNHLDEIDLICDLIDYHIISEKSIYNNSKETKEEYKKIVERLTK